MKQLILSITLLIIFNTLAFSQQWYKNVEPNKRTNLKELSKAFDEYWKDKKPARGSGWKQFKRFEAYWTPRINSNGELPDMQKVQKEWTKFQQEEKPNNSPLFAASWTIIGPTNKPASGTEIPPGIGRVNCLAIHPTTQSTLLAGSAYGGIWKSTNGGTKWDAKMSKEFLSIGISDISYSKSNPDIVYAATGDGDGTYFMSIYTNFSSGIIKSTDGGETWRPTNYEYQLKSKNLVYRVLVHPSDANLVYAATNEGVYKSTDGGTAWEKINDNFCRDLEFNTLNYDELFGAFKISEVISIQKMSSSGELTEAISSSSITNCSRATIYVYGKIVFVLVSDTYGGFHSLWKSANSGNSWSSVNTYTSKKMNYLISDLSAGGMGGQGEYDLALAFNPKSENEVYIGGVNVWRSTDGGNNFTCVGEWQGTEGVPWVHADQHAFEFNNDGVLYACHDGGISKTTNRGGLWTDLSNGLQITQFYRIGTSATNEKFIIGGTQDNGTMTYNNGTWTNVIGGDGMEALVDFQNANTVYGSNYYGYFYRSTDGGKNFKQILSPEYVNAYGAWVTPLVMNPTDPKTLYAGYNKIWKTTNRGDDWEALGDMGISAYSDMLQTIAIAPSNSKYIYAASFNTLYYSTNNGSNWASVYTTTNSITGIAVDPVVPSKCWITISNYQTTNKVVEIKNGNATDVTYSGLPNVPVNCIVYQKDSKSRLFVGTDVGVYYKDNSTNNTWVNFSQGLPNVNVLDLEIHYGSGKLRAGTFGRGIWETVVTDCDLAVPAITRTGDTAFCKGDSLILEVQDNYSSYKWNDGSTNKKLVVKSSGSYYVTVTDSKNCNAVSETISVVVGEAVPFTVSINTQNPICKGDSVQLIATFSGIGNTISWSNGATGKRIWVKEGGVYAATLTTNSTGCHSYSAPVTVTVNPVPDKPVISQKGDTLFCSVTADRYQWYVDEVLLPKGTNKTLYAKNYGKYVVYVYNQDNCYSISDPYIITGVDENENSAENVKVFPNPAKNNLNIEINLENLNNIEIIISDISGKQIFQNNEIPQNYKYSKIIDISSFPSGSYLVYIKTNNQIFNKKIIKL